MKAFCCDCSAQNALFFDNVICNACTRLVGYCADAGEMLAFDPAAQSDRWRSRVRRGLYRQCQNYALHQVCNWMVPDSDENPLCRACRLTDVIPDLSQPSHVDYWRNLEAAKRHVLFSVLSLGLPLASKQEDPDAGLSFRFMADRDSASEFRQPLGGAEQVNTGYHNGEITINLAEADPVARTRTRIQLGEQYRTLLGHFRHEIGHYYWVRLVAAQPTLLAEFREVFGDERADYAAALERHYSEGPAPDWRDRFISAYASMHPWEDWAECWAHYLHMTDTLETAESCQMQLRGGAIPRVSLADARSVEAPFDELIDDWRRLAIAMDLLNRSMGKSDPYPFVLTTSMQRKLQWIHRLILAAADPHHRLAMRHR